MPVSTLASPRQRRKDARPQELIDAALALFVEKGFAATRTEEVAARAGVSKGTLYLYYPSKEELLKAVIRERISSEIEAGAQEIQQHRGSSGELLRRLLAPWWLRMYDSPASGVFKLVITEVRSFPDIAEYYFREVVEPGHRIIGAVLRKGMHDGELRTVDFEAAVHSLLLPMVMLCVHKHSFGALSQAFSLIEPREFIVQHLDLVLRGLELPSAPVRKPSGPRRKRP
jgi:AcrR family transcriptional regulator